MAKFVSFSRTDEKFMQYGDRGIQKRIDSGDMTADDAEHIRAFVDDLRANSNIGEARAYKITNALSNLTRFIKTPFADNQLRDLHAGANAIKHGQRILAGNMQNAGKLSQNTQRDYILFLKRFYLWMIEEGYTDLPQEKVRKIKAPSQDKMTKTAEQMLTEEEITAMIHSCNSSTATRDKALVSTLYESGMRIHEVAGLKWSDLKFDRYFVKINTAGKTGIPRYIPLTASKTYLTEWRAVYPDEADGGNPVFITKAGKSLQYAYTKNLLRRIAKRAGVKKHINPHLFRHSRITNMIRQGFSESAIKLMMWGNLSSEQFASYAHLCNADLDAEVARAAGLDVEEYQQQETFKTRICSRCNHINAPDINFCGVCGAPLTKQTALDLEGMKEEIHGDGRFIKIISDLQKKVEALESIS